MSSDREIFAVSVTASLCFCVANLRGLRKRVRVFFLFTALGYIVAANRVICTGYACIVRIFSTTLYLSEGVLYLHSKPLKSFDFYSEKPARFLQRLTRLANIRKFPIIFLFSPATLFPSSQYQNVKVAEIHLGSKRLTRKRRMSLDPKVFNFHSTAEPNHPIIVHKFEDYKHKVERTFFLVTSSVSSFDPQNFKL